MKGYPPELVRKYLYKPQSSQEETKYITTLVLPYIKDLNKPLTNLCKKLEIKLLYKRSTNLGNILSSHRPKKEDIEKKNVIYKVNCENCDTCYIGQTKRQLGTRMNEQIDSCNKAKRQGHVNSNNNDTGLPKHALEHNHTFDVAAPSILHEEKNTSKRKCLEGMFIHLHPNTCNTSAGTAMDPIWSDLLEFFMKK